MKEVKDINRLEFDSKFIFNYRCLVSCESCILDTFDSNFIVFVLSGEISLKNEEATYSLSANSMMLLTLGESYNIRAKHDCDLLLCHFRYSDLVEMSIDSSVLDSYYPDQIKSPPILCFDDVFRKFLEMIFLFKKSGDNHLNETELPKLMQRGLFVLLHAHFKRDELATFFHPILDYNLDFKEKVLLHYKSAKTANELARACGYGEKDFGRKFFGSFEMTPYQWMLSHTASKVIKLIKVNRSFKEIMYECEFSSPAHFTKFCKKHFGKTPSEIKKMYQEE